MEGQQVPLTQLQPVSGLPVIFGAKPAVVVFVRDLHGTTARIAIQKLTAVWSKLDASGVQLAAVTRTDLEYARDYVPRHHVIFPLVVDEDGAIREQFGLATDKAFMGSLGALRPTTAKAWFDGLSLSRDLAMPNGDLGGEFAIDRAGRVAYSRLYKGALDLPDVPKLMAAVGC